MNHEDIVRVLNDYIQDNPLNFVNETDAIYPELAGMQIFELPIVGVASADDPVFTEDFKQDGVISPRYRGPKEWLPEARSVISFFLPFTDHVKRSNRKPYDEPYEPGLQQECSADWLHARIEGQFFLNQIADNLCSALTSEGYHAICPTNSGKLEMITPYISTWSERHAAYAAGLGTFGLSKGLITAKGIAGRFGSVITDALLPPTPRPYESPFEYCNMCGACQRKCPVNAIDKTRGCALGKDQNICGPYIIAGYLPPHGPNQIERYGCGKCQCGVPCESRIPKKINK